MELVRSVCIGSFFAYFLRHQVAFPALAIDSLLVVGLAALPFIFQFRVLKKFIVVTWAFVWVLAHSPAYLKDSKDFGVVYKAPGCGDTALDVLVEIKGAIYLTKTRALAGDVIKLKTHRPLTDYSHSQAVIQFGQRSFWCSVSSNIRTRVIGKFARFPNGIRQWLESFVMGLESNLDSVTNSSLRKLGLLHIVVLSGAHLTLVASLILSTIQSAPLVMFSLRLISMKFWPKIWMASLVITILFVALFACAVGLSPSIQRSLIMFVVFRICSIGLLNLKSHWHCIQFSWCVQCITFPINIWSTSNLLSWAGALIVNASLVKKGKDKFQQRSWAVEWIGNGLKMQLQFGVLALLVFSFSGLGQVLANIVFGPFFALALALNTWIVCFGYDSQVSELISGGQLILLSWVIHTAAYFSNFPSLFINIPSHDPKISNLNQCLLIVFIIWLLFRLRQKQELN